MPQIIPNSGKAHWVDVFDPATRAAQATTYYGAWGGTSTAPALTDTALGSEHPEARVATTITQQTTSSTGDTVRHVFEITATGNRSVQESGVFNASTTGTLVYRGTHALLNIETGDRVEYTFNDRVADSSE